MADAFSIVLSAFKRCDISGEGLISRQDLKSVFQEMTPSLEEVEIDHILNLVEKKGDGQIAYKEFLSWLFGKSVRPGRCCEAPKLSIAEAARGVPSMVELLKVLQAGGCCGLEDLGALESAVQLFEEGNPGVFFSELLPFICDEAVRYQTLFPQPIAIVDESATASARLVEWSQRQCLCILCNSFLCAWPSRSSRNCRCEEAAELPSINFDEMLCRKGRTKAQAAKCQMFLHYIQKQRSRLANIGDAALQRTVRFLRTAVGPQGNLPEPSWCESAVPLCKMQTRPLRTSIDDAKEMLRADFANALIGGGSIAHGCVQEEIMFACHPEMNCARLVFTAMMKHEAFVLSGAERFAEPSGYASGLGCQGAYDDPVPPTGQGGILDSHITAIDAVDYRQGSAKLQFSEDGVSRELLKAYAGFAPPLTLGAPKKLATGNWGAGAFAGDAQLKVLIQWAAASQAGISEIHYFPFDRADLLTALPLLDTRMREKGVTVGQLCSWLLHDLDQSFYPPGVFEQLDKKFGTSCSGSTSTGDVKVGDNVQVPDKGTGKVVDMTTTDALLQFRDGSKKWYDVEDVMILLSKKISASEFQRGDAFHIPGKGQAVVVEATTTDVQLQFQDGSSTWHDVEDLTVLLQKAVSQKFRRGDSFKLAAQGEAKVIESTTTDVQLEFADGSKRWYDVQDLKRVMETTLQSAVSSLKHGDAVQVPDRGKASVIQMTTTDVQVQFLDGNKKWYDIEDLEMMMCDKISSSTFKPGDVMHMPGKGKALVLESTTTDAKLNFKDGSSIWHDVEDLTKLLQKSISHDLRRGDTVHFPGKGEATVLDVLTTDLQLEFADGSKAWYDVEDFTKLLDQKLDVALGGLKRGDTLQVPTRGAATVVEMTTTDVQLEFASGNKKWYDVEDLSTMMSKFVVASSFSSMKHGDSVFVPGKGRSTVIECTTTDVHLEFEDGTKSWYDVEDLIKLAYDSISHDLRPGDTVQLPGNEEAIVTSNTTTDVQLTFRDGSTKWYEMEDFEEMLKESTASG